MKLYLLRHGIAADLEEADCSRDADRPLTPKGKRRVRAIAAALKRLGVKPGLILTSPYLRARQTAGIVAEILGAKGRLRLCSHLTPGGNARRLIEFIQEAEPEAGAVLLVGHEPYLSSLASWLVTGSPSSTLTLKKGGVCLLNVSELTPGRCATLEWLLTPRQMRLMAA